MITEVFTNVYSESNFDLLIKWLEINKGIKKTVVDCFGMGEKKIQTVLDLKTSLISCYDKNNYPLDFFAFNEFIKSKKEDGMICFCHLFRTLDPVLKFDEHLLNLTSFNKSVDLDDMVRNSLCSIDHMVKYEKEINNQGFVLDGHVICGNMNSWKLFLGFYKGLIQSYVIDKNKDSLDIVANLYNLYFKEFCFVVTNSYSR